MIEMESGGVVNALENGDAPESDQPTQDGLLSQDQQELSERVSHLEKRVREQEDEIVCLKGALADVMRRLVQVETTKSQNSVLPSRPFKSSTPRRYERPKSQVLESSSFTHRSSAPSSARQSPRGASANTMKKWGSIEDTQGQKPPRPHSNSLLNQSKRLSTSHGSLPIKPAIIKGIKEASWNEEDKYVRMYLRGRPVPLYAPSDIECYEIAAEQDPPEQKLELEWVYGYRGRDCRSNIYTIATGEVVYFNAAVVVLHNFTDQTQRHYTEHTDDIKCIAIHPDQVKVATGQVAGHDKKEGQPHVRVWESINLTTLHVIGEGQFQRGVCCVSFSKFDMGKQIAAVDEGNNHIMSVWDISNDNKKPSKLAESKSSGDTVTQCEFHPSEENTIVCCGVSQITFWTLEGNKLEKKSGIFQKNEKPKVVICFCFAENGDVVSGDSNGTIYVWGKGSNTISHALPGSHDGGVFSLCATKDGYILSGGKDRKIYQWNKEYEKTGVEAEIPEVYGGVRMISQGTVKLFQIGTIRNVILQGNFELDFAPVVEGHMEELWGLDAFPKQHRFLTCGSDKNIYCWDAQSHSCVWRKQISDSAHCCSIHPNKDQNQDDKVEIEVAAIGLQTGRWIVIDLQNQELIYVCEDGKEQHECIQYSPDGRMLAVGCRDNYIYVYDVSEDGRKYRKVGRCHGHSSYVTHVDWSVDGNILRSNSGDYEVLYWDAKKCKQETQKDDVRDLKWATQSCTLSFDAIGVWPEHADGTDVNSCAVSHNRRLLASADDCGKVNLFVYPSRQPKAVGSIYSGHSSHVTNVRFLFDSSRLLSIGGRDMSVMQWEVID